MPTSGSTTENEPLTEITNLTKPNDFNSWTENRQVDPFSTIDAFQEEEVESVRNESVEELDYTAHTPFLIDVMNSTNLLQIPPEPSEHVHNAHHFGNNPSGNAKESDHKRHVLSVIVTAAKRWKYVDSWFRRKTCFTNNRLEGNQTGEPSIVEPGHDRQRNVVIPSKASESNCFKNNRTKNHTDCLRIEQYVPKAIGAVPRTATRISSNRQEVMVHRMIKVHD